MKLLLDTHAVLWWLSDDAQLSRVARDAIVDPANDLWISVVSLWEIQVKVRIGKLEADLREIVEETTRQGFKRLALEVPHLIRLGTLPQHHKDPFDHLLLAQAMAEDFGFITADRHAPLYDVRVLA